ncbi:molybdate ABC transporter permease subunit [Novosphingobium sp. 9]|uniref:molybdate ABC transporter permease subunit n=1 Tax=Novosphingobium sp. 9 TaxID=2025349 RepID=UPI0021B5FEE9|nr:molybdate ABC transporter permease subunit [Novosphingobium sp. 9]
MALLSPEEWQVVALSLKVSGVAMVCALPVAFGLAWLLARTHFPGRILVDALVHLPLVLPPVVTGWLLLLVFAPNAPLGGFLQNALGITLLFRWTGAALAAAVMALPLMVRAMRLSLEAVDRRLESAARTLGAGRWRTFFTITLPLASPGVLAGLVLGFARSVGEFGATITFASNIPGETQTLPLAIYSALQVPGQEWQVARLAMLSVLLSVGALVLSEVLARRNGLGSAGGAGLAGRDQHGL